MTDTHPHLAGYSAASFRRMPVYGGTTGGVTTRPERTTGAHGAHPSGCPCPVCVGLRTFERPRFFAGQLLTDTDLSLLQQYVLDKHRLHNVHLHGWGVVCGLQVRCDDCGDGVIVESGYAIDPCGNDIIVPEAQRVDVLRLIQQCVQQTVAACDPPRYELPPGCDGDDTWCLYVRYREWNTRAVMPLAGSAPSACSCGGAKGTGGGCRCGGSRPAPRPGWECTCGGSANAGTCGCGGSPRPSTNPECEPTRTRELYEFGVCRSDGSCHDLAARLAGTFPARALECLTTLQPVFRRHIGDKEAKQLGALVLLDSSASVQDPHDAVCALYEAVLELYRTDPMRTTCTLPAELAAVDCSPRGTNEETGAFLQRMAEAARALVVLLVAYLRDCICYQLLPPCPEPSCDDRVVLACLTVRDGVVVDICNFDCRRHAGSFVSRNHWLPIGPLLSHLVGMLCCFPLLVPPKRRGLAAAPQRLRSFMVQRRGEKLRTAVAKDDFALAGHWLRSARDMGRALREGMALDWLDRRAAPVAEGVNLAAFVNMAPETAEAGLVENGLTVRHVVLGADEAVPPSLGLFPAAAKGRRLVAYQRAGRVVGFAPDTQRAPRKKER